MSKHTPGPWSACQDGKCKCKQVWSKPADHPVAVVEAGEWGDTDLRIEYSDKGEPFIDRGFLAYGSIDEETAIANARLIAAAPDLLEALKPLANWAETIYDSQSDDETKDIWVLVGEIRKAAALIEQVKGSEK